MRAKATADVRPRPPFPIKPFAQELNDPTHCSVHSDVEIGIRLCSDDAAGRDDLGADFASPQRLTVPVVRIPKSHRDQTNPATE